MADLAIPGPIDGSGSLTVSHGGDGEGKGDTPTWLTGTIGISFPFKSTTSHSSHPLKFHPCLPIPLRLPLRASSQASSQGFLS